MSFKLSDFFEIQIQSRRRSRLYLAIFLLLLAFIVAGLFGLPKLIEVFFKQSLIWEKQFNASGIMMIIPFLALIFSWLKFLVLPLVGLTAAAILILALMAFFSDPTDSILKLLKARKLNGRETNLSWQRLVNVTEELALASGLPCPDIYVLPREKAPNAFTSGFGEKASLVMTQGALDTWNREELQAVAAHEISHLVCGDVKFNGILSNIIHGLGLPFMILTGYQRVTDYLLETDDPSWSPVALLKRLLTHIWVILGVAVALALPVFILLGLCVGVGMLLLKKLQAAACRQREIQADALAVEFTRNPEALISALRKIEESENQGHIKSLGALRVSHLFITAPQPSKFGVHPPIETRIRLLKAPNAETRPIQLETESKTTEPRPDPGLEGGLATAADFYEHLPPAIIQALHTADSLPALLASLWLEDGPELLSRQTGLIRDRLGEPALQTALEYRRLLAGSAGQAPRLPILDLAAPTLRQLPRDRADQLIGLVKDLAAADSFINLSELAAGMVLTNILSAAKPVLKTGGRVSNRAAAPYAAELLAIAAHNARPGRPREAEKLYSRAAAFLEGSADKDILCFKGPECQRVDLVQTALEKLAGSGPGFKRNVLLAILNLNPDHETAGRHYELVRAVAAALNVPMPIGSVN